MEGSPSNFRKFAATALRCNEGKKAFDVFLSSAEECEALAKEFYYIGCSVNVQPLKNALSVTVPMTLEGQDISMAHMNRAHLN
jgi:hypothetical protein